MLRENEMTSFYVSDMNGVMKEAETISSILRIADEKLSTHLVYSALNI